MICYTAIVVFVVVTMDSGTYYRQLEDQLKKSEMGSARSAH
jgi:hypothetical protein